MITAKIKHPAPGVTLYSYQINDINGDVIHGGSICHSIGFMDEYAPAGKTGLQHWTEYYDRLEYEQISRDVLQSMIDAQAAEIERIRAGGVTLFQIACHRSQWPALCAIERAIISYSASMRIK